MVFQVALEFSTAFHSPKALEETDSSISSEKVLNVTILADEWKSLKGGLSTFNRELAIHLASCSDTKLTVFVPHGACGEEEKAKAEKEEVSIIEAEELIASSPHEELFFPPEGLKIDVIIGHGVKLGRQAQNIRRSMKCMWVQVVHTAAAELGMYKRCSNAVTQSGVKNELEVDLCKKADLVMAVGPKLKGFYSDQLRHGQRVITYVMEFTPGIMRELNGVELSPNENHKFQVLMFGRGDDEDFELKGYDIAAKAFASHKLKNNSYHLTFVGAAPGKEDEFADKIIEYKMSKNQLSVEEYIKDRDRLKELLLRMDLVIMPSRTEGFGLTALEALSAGLPVLAGRNSGFSEALQKVEFGELCVVKSDEPEDWSEAIKNVRQKERKKRLKEMQRLRESYGQKYNWAEQCKILVEEMRRKVFGRQLLFFLSFLTLSKPLTIEAMTLFESAFYLFFSFIVHLFVFLVIRLFDSLICLLLIHLFVYLFINLYAYLFIPNFLLPSFLHSCLPIFLPFSLSLFPLSCLLFHHLFTNISTITRNQLTVHSIIL